MNKVVNLAIIGCGSITMKRHAPECIINSDLIKIKGFFDINKERAHEMARQYGGTVYETFDDVIKDQGVDGVIICTANKFHAEMTINALENGKHVLCEKPIAPTKEEAIMMIKAAENAKKYLMIGHNQRTEEIGKKAKNILSQGTLGKIISFKTIFAHSGPDNWSADKGTGTWFLNKDSAGLGVIGDLGIHKVDLIRWLINDNIEHVTAKLCTLDKKDKDGNLISFEDNAFCILESKTGIIGTLHASWTNYGDCENKTILYCENGTIKIDKDFNTIEIVEKEGITHIIKVTDTESGVVKSFANCIIKKTPPLIDGTEGLKALNIVLKCIESSQKCTRVAIND